MRRRTHGEWLRLMLEYGSFSNPESKDFEKNYERGLDLLARIAPETMTQQEVARRWPHVLAAMIVESGGYFTPESAANAIIRYKSGDSFGCEYYSMLAGFERDGWPRDPKEYRAKLRTAQRRQMIQATECKCMSYTLFAPVRHKYGRHAESGSRSVGNPGTRERALALVKRLADEGSSHQVFASWF